MEALSPQFTLFLTVTAVVGVVLGWAIGAFQAKARIQRMTDDWQVWQQRDLPPDIWDYLKRERFFGMIVPKEYGGLGFSAAAHSEVIQTLSTRSMPLAITAALSSPR